MRILRSKLFLFLYIIFLIGIYVFAIITSKYYLAVFFIILLLLSWIITGYCERKPIVKTVKQYLDEKNYYDAIIYLNNKIPYLFNNSVRLSCTMDLILLHMINDDSVSAKALLEANPRLKQNKSLYYIQLILACAISNMEQVEYFSNKILNSKKKIHINQKRLTEKIIKMLNEKVFDQELYDETNYPLLKKICLTYTDTPVEIEDLSTNNQFINSVIYKDNKGILKALKYFFNAITTVSFVAAAIVIAFKSTKNGIVSSIDMNYYYSQSYWIFYLFIIIPFINLFFSICLKCKKFKYRVNMVLSIITMFLLLMFGTAMLTSYKKYSTDKMFFSALETIIAEPSDYQMITEEVMSEQTNFDGINAIVFYRCVIIIEDDGYDETINKNIWLTEMLHSKGVSNVFVASTLNYDYFRLYCADTNEFNKFYKNEEYRYIAIAYNIDSNCFIIETFMTKQDKGR